MNDIRDQASQAAPTNVKITLEHVRSKVRTVEFHVFPGSRTTVCCLTLQNGFVVTGESACVDPSNFDKTWGEKLAHRKAVDRIWELEAYLLRDQQHQFEQINQLKAMAEAYPEEEPRPDPPAAEVFVIRRQLSASTSPQYLGSKPSGGHYWYVDFRYAHRWANKHEADFFVRHNLAPPEQEFAQVAQVDPVHGNPVTRNEKETPAVFHPTEWWVICRGSKEGGDLEFWSRGCPPQTHVWSPNADSALAWVSEAQARTYMHAYGWLSNVRIDKLTEVAPGKFTQP